MKKNIRNFLFFVTLCLVVALVPMKKTNAATYTAGDLSLSITDGQAILTMINDSSVAPIQLTKKLVTKDGAIDPETGTVYLRWMSNSLYAYNYTLQKSDAKVNLILVDTGVTSLEISSSNVNVLTGYYTSAGKKSLLTFAELKSKLGIEETEEEKKKREAEEKAAEEAAKKAAEEAAAKKAAEEAAQKAAEEAAAKKAAEEAAQKAAEEAAKKKAAEEAAQKAAEEAAAKKAAEATKTQTQQQNATVKDGVSLKMESGKAVYAVTKSGKTVNYVMPLKNVDRYGIDKNGTLWIKGQKGCLYLWNYELQSSASTIKLIRVTSKKCTGLAFSSSGKVTGYYLAGSTVKKNVWSKSKIKKALAGKTTVATKTKEKVTTTSKQYTVVAYKNTRKLMSTTGKKKDSFRIKNNAILYHGVRYRNVVTAVFNEKGTLLLLVKNGDLVSVNRSSFKITVRAKNVSHFNYTKWGTARYAVKKDGTRIKVSKY